RPVSTCSLRSGPARCYRVLPAVPWRVPRPWRSARRTTSIRRWSGSAKEGRRSVFALTGRRALVTGASGAIGGAIARALHGQGAIVGLSGTRREALEALAADLAGRWPD